MHNSLIGAYGYLRGLWRRRWIAVVVAWVICLVIWLAAMLIPERYEASAKVYVDTRTPLRPVLEGIAIEEDYESQLSLVREALLSRPQLVAVARAIRGADDLSTAEGLDAAVTELQKQINVSASAALAGGGPGRDTVYEITYRHEDRNTSVQVVRDLLDNFVQGTLQSNRTGANEAQSFLTTQIGDLEKRLGDAEERLAEFKKRNVGMLPGEGRGDYFSRLDSEMQGLQAAETNLAIAVSRRGELLRQLSSARQFVPGTSNTSSPLGATGASIDVSLRVQEAEARLEELLLRFTDRHPEVIALRQTINELKAREAKELADLAKGGPGTGAIRSLSVNPVYQSIQVQLNQVEVEIASLRGAASQHRSAIAELKSFVDSAPEVEQEFARLNRDYGVTKAQYETLVARREQAQITDDAAQLGIVRFEVLEPPRAGPNPVSANRSALIVFGLLLGVGGGLLAALLPYLIKPTYDNIGTLAETTGLPVLGAVSAVRLPGEDMQFRRESRRVALAGGALVAVCICLVAFATPAVRLVKTFIA